MLEIDELHKIYPNGCHALKGVSLKVEKGDFLVVIGLSGSGKSTLLRCINKLQEPTKGTITFKNETISDLKGRPLRNSRSQIGMIFQNFNLIDRKKVITNVLTGSLSRMGVLPSVFEVFPKKERDRALEYLEIVGLSGKELERVDSLSGGQKQRVAIARALMQSPDLILADEPVASLDPATSNSVMKYLKKINETMGVTIICNLHFLSLVREYASRVVALKDGKLIFQGMPEQINKEWFHEIYGDDAQEVSIK